MKEEVAKKNLAVLEEISTLLDKLEGNAESIDKFRNSWSDCIADMRTELRWSMVGHLDSDGNCDNIIYEGPSTDCTDYVIDHPELKGHCIILANY